MKASPLGIGKRKREKFYFRYFNHGMYQPSLDTVSESKCYFYLCLYNRCELVLSWFNVDTVSKCQVQFQGAEFRYMFCKTAVGITVVQFVDRSKHLLR